MGEKSFRKLNQQKYKTQKKHLYFQSSKKTSVTTSVQKQIRDDSPQLDNSVTSVAEF